MPKAVSTSFTEHSRSGTILQFTDIDGEAGGGLFEEQTVTVQAEVVEEGDGWDEGDYAVKEDVNVTLELKKDSEE